MVCLITHLLHPLTSTNARGEQRFMNVRDGNRLVKIVLGVIAVSATGAYYQTRSFADSYVEAMTVGVTLFYLITAMMKGMKRYNASKP